MDEILAQAQAPVREGLAAMEETLDLVRAEVGQILGEDGSRLVCASGKRLRSTMVLLCAGLGGSTDGAAPTLGAVVELIHLATLIHDDAVDDASLRRGRPTAHVVWDHKVATMLGDMLYARAFEILVGLGEGRVCEEMATVTRIMAQGQMREFLMRRVVPSREVYLSIVHQKTAAFFGACCRAGGLLAGLAPDVAQVLATYGEKVGFAFQITDDVLDYCGAEDAMGKEVGKDLRDGIATLPFIAAVERAGSQARFLREAFVRGEPSRVDELVRLVVAHGGVDEAREVAAAFAHEASDLLGRFPRNELTGCLDLLARYAFMRAR